MAGVGKSSSETDPSYDSESRKQQRAQSKRNAKGRTTDSVSYWKRGRAEHFGIFYNGEATEMSEFINMVSTSDLKFVRGTPTRYTYPLKDKSRLLLDTLVDFSKDGLNMSFDIDEDRPDFFKGTIKKEIAAAKKKIWESVRRVDSDEEDNYSAATISRKTGLSRYQLGACIYHIVDFLKSYLQFLENGLDNKAWTESDFTTLLLQFTTIFMLSPRPGECNKRNQVVGGVPTSSVPDLRFFTNETCPLSLGVIGVAEVKLRIMPFDSEFFSIENLPVDTLGQHAGELLLEYEYSIFEEAVFGILCFRTKVIFTFLKMRDEHFQKILHHKDQSDLGIRSVIYYTKPYDYLIEDQRENILEVLFWLGMQTFW
ncbi:uncharacterized protein LOC134276201 [Saccostrea cucullata]|uniref:uncharacterized protein LOC134276201 n=1 Tax=Saccostrea cuccullata TaxID=36930 RepID=UPI002ED6B4EB